MNKEIFDTDSGETMSLSEKTGVSYRLMTLLGRDIRTQMHSILGLTEIYMESATADRDLIGDFYGKLLMSENQIMDILDDVLEIGNMMREEELEGKDVMSIFEILANLEDEIGGRLAMKGITFSVETEQIRHKEALSNEQMYYGALLRLCKFLIHNMAEGGSLQISICEEAGDEDTFNAVVQLLAEPFTISKEQMQQMLRPYDKISGEIHRNRDEIDLGIVVMKQYIKALGGTVTCEETEDGKIIFTVKTNMEIPAFGEESVTSRRDEPREVPDFSRMKALIVDDDMINLEVGVRLLQNAGLEVTGASGGVEALRIFETGREKFDVILLDIRMPGFNGLDLARKIRASSVAGACDIPIIAMSSNDTEEDLQLSEEAGINLHMVKPIKSQALYGALKEYLQ